MLPKMKISRRGLATVNEKWKRLDMLLHSIAFAPREALFKLFSPTPLVKIFTQLKM